MNRDDIVFWNVDTQYDFVDPRGSLYVKDAQMLIPLWEEILAFVRANDIRLVSTKDHHFLDSEEISDTPNFVTSFPPHCIAYEDGEKSVLSMIDDQGACVVWDSVLSEEELLRIYDSERSLVLLKDKFNFEIGNPNSKNLLSHFKEREVYVFGVAENVCVSEAAMALASNGFSVTVITDAVKGIPGLETPYDRWEALGIRKMSWSDIKKELR